MLPALLLHFTSTTTAIAAAAAADNGARTASFDDVEIRSCV